MKYEDLSHIKTRQKASSTEEALNDQGDKRLGPLMSASLVSAAFGAGTTDTHYSSRGGRDGSYAWVQQYPLPLTKADLATAKH